MWSLLVCFRPPITRCSLAASCTVVLVRRVTMVGTENPFKARGLLKSIWLTSGATLRVIDPFSSTVGVKSTLTPNSFHSIVIVVPSGPALRATGTGNSPPARKLAFSPLRATSVGFASSFKSPFSSSALHAVSSARFPALRT